MHLIQVAVGLVLFALIWLGARWLRRRIAAYLHRRGLPPELVILTSRSFYLAVLVVAGFVWLAVVLAQANIALAGVILATIVASLGVQDILRSYVSGIYILMERNVRVGDHIEFDGKKGTVTELRLRVTYLRDAEGALIVIPNAELFNKTVVVSSEQGGAPEKAAEPPREHQADPPVSPAPPE